MKPIAFITVLLLAIPCIAVAVQQSNNASASHKRGICGEITKLDLLLYDNPRGHEKTATCSYTDDRLLIKPNRPLSAERMKRFVFLAFVSVGAVRNDDYMLPDKTYVGFGTECQVLPTNDAATLQRAAKGGGDSGFMNALMMASSAPKAVCPKWVTLARIAKET